MCQKERGNQRVSGLDRTNNQQSERKGWPSGFEIIGPEEYPNYEKVIETLLSITYLYGYRRIQTPRVVDLSWVKVKGAGSQEIKSGMFGISRIGQNEPPSLVLAFEHTLSLARYLASQGQQLKYPFRRVEVGSVFRGERPQRARKREFTQVDVDVIGLNSPWGEAEVICVMADLLDRLGFPTETRIHLNDRRLLSSLIRVIEGLENEETVASIMRQVDKLDKKGPKEVISEAKKEGLPTRAIFGLIELANQTLEINDPILGVDKLSELIKENNWASSQTEASLELLRETLRLLGPRIGRTMVDIRLTRGLDYYTGLVFEIHHPQIKGSLCGGGRYDDLIKALGGPSEATAIGFALGVDRMVLAMKELGIVKEGPPRQRSVAIITFGGETTGYTLEVASRLRKVGISAILVNPEGKIKQQISRADDENFPVLAIIGGNEEQSGTVTLKNMQTGEQKSVSIDQIETEIKGILGGGF